MDLSIIFVNYKSRGLLRQCLKGLFSVSFTRPFEVILVDNDLQDGDSELLVQEFPQVRFISSPGNIGFGPANNIGIRAARGRFVVFLNPDIVILDDALDQLVRYLERRPDVGIVGPQLVNPDGTVQHSCYRFHEPLIPVYRRTPLGKTAVGKRALESFLMTDWDHKTERPVDWLLGACMMVRREVLERIGPFDEQFFLYFEDTDLCRRAWEQGVQVVYQPNIRMVHYHRRESADAPLLKSMLTRSTRIHITSWIRYLWKYKSKPLPRA
ncbi:MAG: glycosyltransferase family 2 protein [bacterium]|nr:glycosyltransferase family 2 protein [bacterium]